MKKLNDFAIWLYVYLYLTYFRVRDKLVSKYGSKSIKNQN